MVPSSRSTRSWKHNYSVDVTGPADGFMKYVLQADIEDSSHQLQAELDKEYDALLTTESFYESSLTVPFDEIGRFSSSSTSLLLRHFSFLEKYGQNGG